MKKIFLLLLVIPFVWACNDRDDEDHAIDYLVNFATVDNPNQETTFNFVLDDLTRLSTASSAIAYYRPKDGQRVILNYSIISNKPEGAEYKHDIRINDVYEVLTKGIFSISPATEDSIGNDEIHIERIWVGSDYLNVEFAYPGYNKTHYINLVSDNAKTYTDGKIHLEFRHNDNSDYPNYDKWGYVSFDLKSLKQTGKNSVDLVIHTNEFRTGKQTYTLTYNFATTGAEIVTLNVKDMSEKGVIQ
jgi:hypothetical protein